ncbi:MAG: serine/threonine-protein kinase [Planctomycetaceae bacterium]
MMLQSVSVATRQSAGGEASRILAEWPSDVAFTFDAALRKHPEFADRRSVLVDLAYEEFCRLEGRAAGVGRQEFAARFPHIERSLLRVLELHSFCRNDSDIRRAFFGNPWPVAGEEILGFRLVEEIGRGSASRVFLATDPDLSGRTVVIKVGRAHDEAAALGRLEHPGIVPVLSARIDPVTELSVLCMPYWGRGTLLHLIDRLHAGAPPQTGRDLQNAAKAVTDEFVTGPAPDRRPVPRRFADAVALFGAGLGEALAYAHARGIVHSDVKPSNVLVTTDGKPRLLDFNLARVAEADDRLVGGTLPYMAPEQLAAWAEHAGPIGPAADVYSLGATLHELLTGQPPFGRIDEPDVATAAATLAERHRRGPQPIPPERVRGNRQLGRLIAACLVTDPQRRPTAAALAAALVASVPQPRRPLPWLAGTFAAAGIAVAATALWPNDDAVPPTVILDACPVLTDPVALAQRGWQRLSNDDLQLSYLDLKAAHTLDPNPRNAAALGYCVMRLTGDWSMAAQLFSDAAAAGGDTAAVQNALGYCHLKLKDVERAKIGLARALELDPSFEAARRNGFLLELVHARQQAKRPDLDSIRQSLAAENCTATTYLDAACAYAQACEVGDDSQVELLRCCEQAIARGLSPQELLVVTTFHPEIAGHKTFRRLSRAQAVTAKATDVLVERVPPPFPLIDDRRDLESSFAGR